MNWQMNTNRPVIFAQGRLYRAVNDVPANKSTVRGVGADSRRKTTNASASGRAAGRRRMIVALTIFSMFCAMLIAFRNRSTGDRLGRS